MSKPNIKRQPTDPETELKQLIRNAACLAEAEAPAANNERTDAESIASINSTEKAEKMLFEWSGKLDDDKGWKLLPKIWIENIKAEKQMDYNDVFDVVEEENNDLTLDKVMQSLYECKIDHHTKKGCNKLPSNNTLLNINTRHQLVKEERRKREAQVRKRREEQQIKKEAMVEAKRMVAEEEKKMERIKREAEKKINSEMSTIRRQLEVRKQAIKEAVTRENHNSEVFAAKKTEADARRLAREEAEVEEKERKRVDLLHKKCEDLKIQNEKKKLRHYFNIWYESSKDAKVRYDKTVRLADMRLLVVMWRRWRDNVRKVKMEREIEIETKLMIQNERKYTFAREFHQNALLRKYLYQWREWCVEEREGRSLKVSEEKRLSKMDSFLKALDTGALWDKSNCRAVGIDKQQGVDVDLSTTPHLPLDVCVGSRVHVAGHACWHAHLSHAAAPIVDSVDVESHPHSPPALASRGLSLLPAPLPHCVTVPDIVRSSQSCPSLPLDTGNVMSAWANTTMVPSPDGGSCRSTSSTTPSPSSTTPSSSSTIPPRISSTTSPSSTSITRIVKIRRSPLVKAMEERERMRETRKIEAEKRRRKIMDERNKKREEEERAIMVRQEEERKKVEEEWKQKKRMEKERAEAKSRHIQRMHLLDEKARAHYRRYLLIHYGWRPWRLLIKMRKDVEHLAEVHHLSVVARKCLMGWRCVARTDVETKVASADRLYERNLLKFTFSQWKIVLVINKERETKAVEFASRCLKRRALDKWLEFWGEQKFLTRQQYVLAVQHCNRSLMRQVLKSWMQLPRVMREERHREQRLEQLRRKVRDVLPDYKPARSAEN